MTPWLPLSIIALAAVIAVSVVWVASRRAVTSIKAVIKAGGPDAGRVWVIVNPTKPSDYDEFQRQVNAACLELTGWKAKWLETTVEDPGTGQTLQALPHEPRVVLAAGGDGTLRAVAAALAHSTIPLGILPVGTGNLTARNLRLPLDLPTALAVGIGGVPQEIDLAWLRMEKVETQSDLPAEGALLEAGGASLIRTLPPGLDEPHPEEYAYLVVAGLGFDGQTMANTSPRMKQVVGWSAYVYSALQSLHIERMRATVKLYSPGGSRQHAKWTRALPDKLLDSINSTNTLGEENSLLDVLRADQHVFEAAIRARTILFANCGELPFVTLAPDARVDDGALDVIAVDTKAGLVGWSSLAMKVLGQGMGLRPFNSPNGLGQIVYQQAARAKVHVNRPHTVQVDGDAIGTARMVYARVDPGALLIQMPREETVP